MKILDCEDLWRYMKAILHYSRQSSIVNRFRSFSSLLANPELGLPLSEELCSKLLDSYPEIKQLKNLHSRIVIDPSLRFNQSLAVKLMRSYAACGKPTITRQIFDEISEKNIVFFNVTIRSYVNNHFYRDALLVYRTMSSQGISPDNYTYPCVLKACSASDYLAVGLQVHASVIKVGLDSNVFTGNGLVFMYAKCNCLLDARQVLDEMPSRDVVSWNSMVAGYAQKGLFDDALEVCKEMESLNIKPDAGTMASLLPAVTNTSMDNIRYIKKMFSSLTNKTLVSWNVMIAVYVNNSLAAEAVDLYLDMEAHGIQPDSVSLASVLPACGDLSAILLGRQIHKYIGTRNLLPNLWLENALLDMYAKCGCLEEARAVFDEMNFRDVVSWTCMISAYGMSGRGQDAVALFSDMRDSSVSPDSIAFVAILSACSHAGLLAEGRYLYSMMIQKYKITPRIEHFSCNVDLLGRAGQVEEAYEFIKQMPVEPNERVWGALLGACRMHSNMDIGLLAADQLFKLAPEQSGYYVLLSNIYAKAGRWEEVTMMRSIMKSKGIKKMAGSSNLELNGQLYTFLAGEHSHPQSKEIYEELEVLVAKMKELGYVPETESALHDVEEEDKEGHLAVHSEKLAIVFAILNSAHGEPIRITKNLRICGDCHIAAKLISKVAERAITIRDTNRFHHFHNGVCSCADYW